MRSSPRTIRLEAVAYLVILLTAASLRLAHLSWPPLSDSEARAALAASALAGSRSPFEPATMAGSSGSAYVVGTAIIFQLFGSSEVTARVLPALAGMALCVVPLMGRRRLGPTQSLVLTGLLSFSPVLVTVSRQAGGTSLACLGVAGSLLLLLDDDSETAPSRARWAIAFAALALTSGQAWVQGFLGVTLAIALTRLWLKRQTLAISSPRWIAFSRRDVVLGLILLLAIATGLGLVPSRGADTFEGLAAWLSAWSIPPTMPILSALLLIPVYEPLLFVFGIIGAAISFRRKEVYGVGAAFWAFAGLAAAAAFRGRSAADLAWVAIPGAYLAARGLIRLAEGLMVGQNWLRFAGMSGAYFTLAGFIGLQVAGYASGLGAGFAVLDPNLRLGIIFVAVLIWIVLVFLFGTGWSWSASGAALGFSILGILSAISIGSVVRLNFVRQAAEAGQLWQSRVSAPGLHQLAFSLDFLSRAYLDDPGGLTLTIQGDAPPPLLWTIRGYEEHRVSTTDQAPPVVLAHANAEPVLRADYLGQRLVIAETNDWSGPLPPEFLSWWVFRRAPVAFDNWVLLVRADVATQGGLTALGSETNP